MTQHRSTEGYLQYGGTCHMRKELSQLLEQPSAAELGEASVQRFGRICLARHILIDSIANDWFGYV